MKVSAPLLALVVLVSSTSSFVSGNDLGVVDNDVGGTRGFRELKKDDKKDKKKDKNKNNSDNPLFQAVPVGEGGIAETKQCESDLTRTYAFIDAAGHADKGSMECYNDPVNGCGGCCRIGSVYFICDEDNTSPTLPCVCNDKTAVEFEKAVETAAPTTGGEEGSVRFETLELPYDPILVAASDAPTEDFDTLAPTE